MRYSALLLALLASAASAQVKVAGNSYPVGPTSKAVDIPAARDTPYPGTIQLNVDATDVTRGIVTVDETIPVAQPGPMTLLYPEWIPGTHSPVGPIPMVDGLTITADGQPLTWKRDPYAVYAFHVDVPAGARSVVARFHYLSPTSDDQGRVLMTPDMLSLEWDKVSLYPAGYYTRDIPVTASVVYPAGWQSATALAHGLSGDRMTYPTTNYATLVDSPAIAGRYMKSWDLGSGVKIDAAGDEPADLAATPEEIDAHKRLVEQAIKTFGSRHFDHYDFLLTLSDTLGGEGLEHHRSTEVGTHADYFTDWATRPSMRNLLPHEFTHSWNGKFRRPADLWTPDFRTPMGDSLLWVYEGMTQYYGYILQARSGLVSKQDTLDALASTAAYYANSPRIAWRSVEDTTNDPTMNQRRPLPWRSYQGSEDYYSQGQMMWLTADQLIRQRTGGKKSLDDFARLFLGVRNGDWGTLTYTFDDIARTLNEVTPYDWAGFLRHYIYDVNPKPPIDWIEMGGYRLVYTPEESAWQKSGETVGKSADFSYSIGLAAKNDDGSITSVQWGGPAFQAGITIGGKILAVNGHDYDSDRMRTAITAAAAERKPIHLLVKQSDHVRDIPIAYYGGLRYPHLVKVGSGVTGLDALLAPK